MKMETEPLTPTALVKLSFQNHQQHHEHGDGVTDFDDLVKLGFTEPSATP